MFDICSFYKDISVTSLIAMKNETHKWPCNPIPHCVLSAKQCHRQQSQSPAGTELNSCLVSCCFTSTEARWPIRDGDRVGRGRESEGSTVETVRKRPERPWTVAKTMEVLRRCPLAIAQCTVQLLCWTESLSQCPLHRCWRTTCPAPPPY